MHAPTKDPRSGHHSVINYLVGQFRELRLNQRAATVVTKVVSFGRAYRPSVGRFDNA